MKTPLSKATVRQHLTYNWWKYVLVIALSIVCWSLIYTTTAYRPPADKKVDFYVTSGYGDQTMLDQYMESIRLSEMSDMEEMSSAFLTNDEYYGAIQLSTYIMAGEGDVYLLDKDSFQNYAASGAFLALEEVPGIVEAAESAGIDLSRGWRTNTEEGGKHLYGIPATALTGLEAYSVSGKDGFLTVTVNGGNDENSLKFLAILLRDMRAPETATPTDLASGTDVASGTDLTNP